MFDRMLDLKKRAKSMAKVAECGGPLEAHSIRILLEANGVPAIVLSDTNNETGL